MVEGIEKLSTEIKFVAICELELLHDTEIKVNLTRSTYVSLARSTEYMRINLSRCKSWSCEGSRVVPAKQGSVSWRGTAERRLFCDAKRKVAGISNLIGPVAEAPGVAEIASPHVGRFRLTSANCD